MSPLQLKVNENTRTHTYQHTQTEVQTPLRRHCFLTAIRGAISRVVVNRILCNKELMFTGFLG